MSNRRHLSFTALAVLGVGIFLGVFVLMGGVARAQTAHSKGLAVSPAYEGWRENPDGSFDIIFGYMNSNWAEEFDVPIGPGNGFEPGVPDQGQPTHFFPRRNRYVFKDLRRKQDEHGEQITTIVETINQLLLPEPVSGETPHRLPHR